MLLPIESIVEGTWGGDSAPAEWGDYVLMRRMHWSWDQLQSTPMYVRRYCLDILNMISEHEERESKREQSRAERHQAG